MKLKDLPLENRPRERFLNQGAQALSKAELLAILLRSGTAEESVLPLCERLLSDHENSLAELGRCTVGDIVSHYHGIGPAKAMVILAACELTTRRLEEQAVERPLITCSHDIYAHMRTVLQDLDHEECYTIYLNQSHKVLGRPYLISKGGIAETTVDVRLVMREALVRRATALVFAHNHPSGNLNPSKEDVNLTQKLRQAAQFLNLHFLDHLIITDTSYYSFNDHGK